ncbi:MAG: type II restriction endonuclease [Acidobacteriota bacterium]
MVTLCERSSLIILLACILAFCTALSGQTPRLSQAALGSQTAKNGFKNETEIQNKFNNWKTDVDARNWLTAMNYKPQEIESVIAAKPHGEKADVEVRIKTKKGETVEGISIKLVSSANGFNQIDKRWLLHYVTMWKIPADVETAMKYFVGETPPSKTARDPQRMYLNELSAEHQRAVIDFFTANRSRIVHDLFQGDGPHAAGWIMVALKATETTRWTLRRVEDVMRFYGDGKVEITRYGNLKIGRITVQRKGGDGGRNTAKMLQFKINPVQLFDAK